MARPHWEHCRIPKLRRALGCDTGRCRACWSDLDYDKKSTGFASSPKAADVPPPTSGGFGGGETTTSMPMCVDKESEEPALLRVALLDAVYGVIADERNATSGGGTESEQTLLRKQRHLARA